MAADLTPTSVAADDRPRDGASGPGPSERWPQASVLIVDDEPGIRHFLQGLLQPRMERVEVAGSAEEAVERLAERPFDLLLLDVVLPGQSGLALLEALRQGGDPVEVVLMTAFADLDTAIAALRAGAGDFLLKPFRSTQVLHAIQRTLTGARLRRENRLLRRTVARHVPPPGDLIGQSLPMRGLHAALQRVAEVDSTVLLTGEPGTGKELCARRIHLGGPRAAAPFVALHCAELPAPLITREIFGEASPQRTQEGLLLQAQGGTLFLDEVSSLPDDAQAALSRVIEHRKVRPLGARHSLPIDVRIVAATSRPLQAEVAAGRFSIDLYYRLEVVEIRVPALRTHKEDIPDLVHHLLQELSATLRRPPIAIDPIEMDYLRQYDWPGNVRELRNLLERSMLVGALNVSALYQGLARQEAAPAPAPPAVDGGPVLDLPTLEKRHIMSVLDSVGGDKARAAALLGVSRRTLERRVAEWGRA